MCIIIVKTKNVELPPARMIQHLWSKNPDGAGFCVSRDNKVRGFKGYMDPESLIIALRETVKLEDQAIIHLRVGTHGPKNASATHPFPASSDIVELMLIDWTSNYGIAHNGVITGYGEKTMNGLSDTQDYIRKRLHDSFLLYGLFTNREAIVNIVTDDITTDRLAIMRHDGAIVTVGKFHIWEGLRFSNTGYDTWNYRKASKEKDSRDKEIMNEYRKRRNDALSAPGRPATEVPFDTVYGKDEDGVWHPVDKGTSPVVSQKEDGSFDYDKRYRSPASQRVCENCRRLVDVDDIVNIRGVKCCRKCFQDVMDSKRAEMIAENEVLYEVTRGKDGKRFTGKIFYPVNDGKPNTRSLVQRLAEVAKDTAGGKSDWYITARTMGRATAPIEVWSSSRYYARETLNIGAFADNDVVMSTMACDGFFVCPESCIVLHETDSACTDCIHCGISRAHGQVICKSQVTKQRDNVCVALRVAIGASLYDVKPSLVLPDASHVSSAKEVVEASGDQKVNEEDDNR